MSDKVDKLFQRARTLPPDTTRVELGFETRLLARLRAERAPAVPWFAWAWKLAPVFVAIVLALGVWNFVSLDGGADLRSALTGPVDESPLATHLTGEKL